MEEILLGFHLRVPPGQVKHTGQWGARRRDIFLLNKHIRYPLSVDESVWPRCDCESIYSLLFQHYHDSQTVVNGLNVFSPKAESVLKQASSYSECFMTGITVIDDERNFAEKLISMHRIADNPYSVNSLQVTGWACLGFDVADEWLTSGLMNCSSERQEMRKLSERFAHHLNEFGLFSSEKIAEEFQHECEARFVSHAPFAVFGIWASEKPKV